MKATTISMLSLLAVTHAFLSSAPNRISSHSTLLLSHVSKDDAPLESRTRRDFLLLTATAGTLGPTLFSSYPAMAEGEDEITIYKTQTGLKYVELEMGKEDGLSPRYGQLCIVSYKAYLKVPSAKDKEGFDTSSNYIIKHGNGKMIAGLDEGLHTMKEGGLRRMIIPPKLGFTQGGLGPLPQYPWSRAKLNRLLDQVVAEKGGNLIYDVRLEKVLDDEADQGYYEDAEITPEQAAEIERRLNRQNQGVPVS